MKPIKTHTFSVLIISFILFFFISAPLTAEDKSHGSNTVTDPQSSYEAAAGSHDNESGDAGHGGHSADRSGDLIDLLYRVMCFTALVVILVFIFRKTKIMSYFSTRSEEIKKKFEDLQRDKDEAEKRYKEVEEQLKNFELKRNDIIEQYRKEGLIEKDRIISEAKERVKHIVEQSEITIEQEIDSARKKLKQDIIEIASQKAQDILIKEMNEKDQENMVVEFVEKVGKVN